MEDHWNNIYNSKDINKLGWYQERPQPDFDLILELNLPKSSRILIVGAGRTTLVKFLLDEGYENLILVDISQVALDKLQKEVNSDTIKFIQADIGKQNLADLINDDIALWYDRAVLHFLIDKNQIETYSRSIQKLQPEYIILAEFSTKGANRCSGLPLIQYSEDKLQTVTRNYKAEKFIEHIYVNPSGGKRPYIYGVFNK